MRIFLTGGTGFVGSAVMKELIDAGYEIIALARSEAAANLLRDEGVQVYFGNLEEPESLRKGIELADGVIHTAFNHDFSNFKNNCEMDRRVIEAIGTMIKGSNHPFLITSAIGVLPQGKLVTEENMPDFGLSAHFRAATEEAAELVRKNGGRVSVIRLAPTVHGEGDHNFIPTLIKIAREKGVSAYIGEGENRWPAVHRLDAAKLYRLILENDYNGERFHAVGEEGIPFKEIAYAIGRGLNVPVVSITAEKATEHFGWFSNFAKLDIPASNRLTREKLGWQPSQDGLLEDLLEGHYFRA